MTATLPVAIDHRDGPAGAATALRFLGRSAPGDPARACRAVAPHLDSCAFLEQVHSTRVLEAVNGPCGPADGLWTQRRGLALAVVTADCAPVIMSDGFCLAVLHAGWRGIAGRIVAAAHAILPVRGTLRAWIGPTIGPCCYEVGSEVAERIERSSDPTAVTARYGAKARVDLVAALEAQLASLGVESVHRVGPCTSCRPELLWSYRRDGPRAGRNVTIAWLARGRTAPGTAVME